MSATPPNPAPPTATPRTATYRVQLTPSFGFDAVAGLLPSLAELGVSHLYLSPIAEAVPGSSHGYDVVDHTTVRGELGGEDALGRLLDAAAQHHLGVLVDHVPNHSSVAVPHLNVPWWTMLRDGPDSLGARWFDVDWAAGDGRVLVPMLGAPVADVLAAGELRLDEVDGEPVVRYFDHRFPVAAGTLDGDVAEVLDRQHYRLVWWRDPRRNVRRFFTIDDLVGVRVEDAVVAHDVDTIPRRLVEHPAFAGVRIDHVDGLADPTAYLSAMRDVLGDRWLLVEKILAPGETLPAAWPVDGTTGYEHVTHAEHVLLDPAGEAPLLTLWEATGHPTDFDTVEHAARREVLDGGLAPDVDRLVRTASMGAASAGTSTVPDEAVRREAIVELTLGLDRYRTYLPDPTSEAPLADAARRATVARPDLAGEIAAFVEQVRTDPEVRTRWQQLTGPVMAKGAEDRAFYRHLPLASLAEVGGTPGSWTIGVDEFHRHQAVVQEGWPATLVASTTHDTKRSGAVRSRSLALAAHAEQWRRDVEAMIDRPGPPGPLPALDRADVLLALQTAVTAAPIDAGRLGDYLVKAAREAELHTSWTSVDDDYETALRDLADQLAEELDDELVERVDGPTEPADGGAGRWDGLSSWARRVASDGATVGLRYVALQLTVPGVPDLYQGAPQELTSLVDPDNRRPPDWEEWSGLVGRAAELGVVDTWRRGLIDEARVALVHRLLALRARRPDTFGSGGRYAALDVATGPGEGLVAFSRQGASSEPDVVVLVAPLRSGGDPDATVDLPPGTWRDLVVDGGVEVSGRISTPAVWSGPAVGLGVSVLERTDA